MHKKIILLNYTYFLLLLYIFIFIHTIMILKHKFTTKVTIGVS